jgi:hypothetical protein
VYSSTGCTACQNELKKKKKRYTCSKAVQHAKIKNKKGGVHAPWAKKEKSKEKRSRPNGIHF